MSSECVMCHQPKAEVDVQVLSGSRQTAPGGWLTHQWSHTKRQYCPACYRNAERIQHLQGLANLFMILLPMATLGFGGAIVYGVMYDDPNTIPLMTHLLFFASVLFAFIYSPFLIQSVVQPRLDALQPQPATPSATPTAPINPTMDADKMGLSVAAPDPESELSTLG